MQKKLHLFIRQKPKEKTMPEEYLMMGGRGKELWPAKCSEAPRPQAGASRARSGERDASKGNIVLTVPLNPAYKAGLAGHLPVNHKMHGWGARIRTSVDGARVHSPTARRPPNP